MSKLQTNRLYLRNLALQDAEFILQLVNTPAWLEHIGDKKVKNLEEARNYIKHNPARSYKRSKYGLKAVVLKKDQRPIGICGLIQRDYLNHPDLGFAFLPQYSGQGFGYESSKAVLSQPYVKRPVYALTGPDNMASQGLLKKLGFVLEETFVMPPDQFECLKFILR